MITKEQIKNWKAYEKVRRSGKYNMFDLNAMFEAELTQTEYLYCMSHYSELKQAAEQEHN